MQYTEIDYKRLSDDYEKWWNKELDRPIFNIVLKNGPQFTRGELLEFVYDLNLPAEEVMKLYEKQFSAQDFLADGFPFFYVRTTGLLGVFMGQEYEVSPANGTVWYKGMETDPENMHFQVDKNHPMYRRMMELNVKFQDYFKGKAVLGGANLGGVCDVYHSIRGMENTIYDLSDYPDEVKAGMNEIHDQWMMVQKELLNVIDPGINHGYTHWTGILTKVPYDMIQADLAFLVGPDDYREFIHPLIVKEAQAFERSMLHLDGPGFIKHMPDILGIPELNGVQWIPGAGAAPVGEWDEFYDMVDASDKLLQVFIEKPEEIPMIETIVSHFKDPSRICFICSGTEGDRKAYEDVLKKWIR
ncbi:hypothetical protein C0033_18855 [Clostridium sp. chh4-2]|uniref:hypothetical protein n=1 Tax=Clostridium sp. chh4-2 TaxID=2067550 RepID=UPI000CCDB459|nr:hypothetical protein [Clostridium sp. chh4-2]PNV60576.1 hypothetical protein C0033_18855 [Clostridium sp. chh4-2]